MMQKIQLQIWSLLFLLMLVSCGKELPIIEEGKTYTIETVTIENNTYQKIAGIINDSLLLSKNNAYLLDGKVVVNESGLLVIEKGSHIYADKGALLLIERKGQLKAIGTEPEPIVFTSIAEQSNTALPGDWVGIHINGQAAVNERSEGLLLIIGKYGRLEDEIADDNSGILSYIRVQYAGEPINNEYGGINLNGVGSGTKIDHIQAYKCLGTGLKIRGGNVNIANCLSTQSYGSGIIWDNGWTGKGQYWIVNQTEFINDTITLLTGRSNSLNQAPRSNPVLSNITLTSFPGMESRGLRLTNGTLGNVNNMIVTNTKRGIRADFSVQEILNKQLSVSHSVLFNNFINFYDNEESAASLFQDVSFNNSIEAIQMNGYIGSSTQNATDPSVIDTWFKTSKYVGAVENDQNDWTKNWAKQ
jgi:hypothetical protein